MSIKCDCIDFIIPIININKVYPGGFEKYKSDNIEAFDWRYSHDKFLFRNGAMNRIDIELIKEEWEKLGLKGKFRNGSIEKWKDYCIFESMFGDPIPPCDWLIFDSVTKTVSYKI